MLEYYYYSRPCRAHHHTGIGWLVAIYMDTLLSEADASELCTRAFCDVTCPSAMALLIETLSWSWQSVSTNVRVGQGHSLADYEYSRMESFVRGIIIEVNLLFLLTFHFITIKFLCTSSTLQVLSGKSIGPVQSLLDLFLHRRRLHFNRLHVTH